MFVTIRVSLEIYARFLPSNWKYATIPALMNAPVPHLHH